MQNVFDGILLFCHVVSFIDMVETINYIQSGRAEETLSFGKKKFCFSPLLSKKNMDQHFVPLLLHRTLISNNSLISVLSFSQLSKIISDLLDQDRI